MKNFWVHSFMVKVRFFFSQQYVYFFSYFKYMRMTEATTIFLQAY